MKYPVLDWILRLIPALILLQTLFFKFTAAPESVYIFSTLGAEPVGRIGSGIVELIAGICLLFRPSAGVGALLAAGTMAGAILSHLTILGIEIMGDGGQLFFMALIAFVCSAVVAWQYRTTIPVIGRYFVVTG